MSLPKRKRVPTARALAFKEEKDELRRKHHGRKPALSTKKGLTTRKGTTTSNRPRGRPRKKQAKKKPSSPEEVSDTESPLPTNAHPDQGDGAHSDPNDQTDKSTDSPSDQTESTDKSTDDAKPNGQPGRRPRGRPKGSGRRRRKPLPPKTSEKRPRGRPRKSLGDEPTNSTSASPRKSKRKAKVDEDDDDDEPGPLGDELDLLQDDEEEKQQEEKAKEEIKGQKSGGKKKLKKPQEATVFAVGRTEEEDSDLPVVLLDAELPENFEKDFKKEFRVVMWDELLGDPHHPYQSTKGAAEKKTKSGIQMKDVVGIFTYNHPKVAAPLLDDLPSLRVVSNFGVGYDHIDGKAAAERKIPVGHTPGVLSDTTADMAFALLLAIARNVVSGHQQALHKKTLSFTPNWLGTQVTGATIGIVGLGRIGLEVAKRAALGFNMKVLYHTRTQKKAPENFKIHYCEDLKTLLSQSDFVVLCVPQTPETTHLINSKRLKQMKKSAFLINVARGAVVDQDALTNALNDGVIAGAALDVTDPEPLPRKHPLLFAKNLIITPHFGSATTSTRRKMFDMSFQNLLSGIAGKPLPNSIPETADIPGRVSEY